MRVLPGKPDFKACFDKKFPTVPDRDLKARDVTGIISDAMVLDAEKTGCGNAAQKYIDGVDGHYGGSARHEP